MKLPLGLICAFLISASSAKLFCESSPSKTKPNINLNELFNPRSQSNVPEATGNAHESKKNEKSPIARGSLRGTVRVRTSLRVRKDAWGTTIGKLYNGDRVRVYPGQSKPNWYKISKGNLRGYSHKNYISLDPNQALLTPLTVSSSSPFIGELKYYSVNSSGETTLHTRMVPMPLMAMESRSKRSSLKSSGPLKNRVDTSHGGAHIKNIPAFKQLGPDPFSADGKSWQPNGYCGPTSLQMVLAYYGIERSRDDLALTACNNNGKVTKKNVKSSSHQGQVYAKGNGGSWSAIVNQGKRFGFKRSKVGYINIKTLRNRIAAGRPQIVSVAGYLRFKNGKPYSPAGHLMVVTGVKANGDIIINDPIRGKNMIMTERDFARVWRRNAIDIRK